MGGNKKHLVFQDDANNDPQWSEEQLIEAKFCFGGLDIGRCEVDIMSRSTVAIFEILEKAWATQNCTLVDMKVRHSIRCSSLQNAPEGFIDHVKFALSFPQLH